MQRALYDAAGLHGAAAGGLACGSAQRSIAARQSVATVHEFCLMSVPDCIAHMLTCVCSCAHLAWLVQVQRSCSSACLSTCLL